MISLAIGAKPSSRWRISAQCRGSPLYDSDGGIEKLVDEVISDIRKLQSGGVDAIMFGNENDRPYLLEATSESIAAMATIIATAKSELTVPFGVNYLWDPAASVAIGAATGAFFVREIFNRRIRLRYGHLGTGLRETVTVEE